MSNEELNKILPDDLLASRVERSLKIHASPDGALGETWIIKYGSRWLSLYRGSMLDGYTRLELNADDPSSMERVTYGLELTLNGKEGEHVVLEVSSLDQDRVEAFFDFEEKLDSLKEAEERLSVTPGTIVPVKVPDDEALPLESAPDAAAPTSSSEPEEESEREDVTVDDEVRPHELEEDELEDRLIELIQAGRRVGAIKFYREANGGTLSEAKEYIDDLAYLVESEDLGDDDEPRRERAVQLADLGISELLEGELIGYLKLGRRDVAHRRLREAKGLGMVEATEAVQQLAAQHELETSGGSGYWWRLFWILLAAAAVIAYLRFLRVE